MFGRFIVSAVNCLEPVKLAVKPPLYSCQRSAVNPVALLVAAASAVVPRCQTCIAEFIILFLPAAESPCQDKPVAVELSATSESPLLPTARIPDRSVPLPTVRSPLAALATALLLAFVTRCYLLVGLFLPVIRHK